MKIKEKYIELAAQAWCEKETEHLTMIPELAIVFAGILQEETESVPNAVKTLTNAIKKDEGFYMSYQANIAVAFQDEYDRNKPDIHEISNTAAKYFIDLWCKEPTK